jgi:hypothetical protein
MPVISLKAIALFHIDKFTTTMLSWQSRANSHLARLPIAIERAGGRVTTFEDYACELQLVDLRASVRLGEGEKSNPKRLGKENLCQIPERTSGSYHGTKIVMMARSILLVIDNLSPLAAPSNGCGW